MSKSSTNSHRGHPRPATKGASGRAPTALAVGLVLLLVLLRLVYLSADTPTWLSGSAGLYVDEGYKTLSPRNLVLFGTTHWSPTDAYSGWMSPSPITQWSYYASFRLFGVDIKAARYVTVAFFAVFLCGFVLATRRRYGSVLLLGGLALLGLESILFLLSRIAVFEFPIIALFYGLLFVFARTNAGRLVTPALLAIGMSAAMIFGIKVSALLYLAPVFLAASLFIMLQEGFRRPLIRLTFAIVAVLSLVALLVLTRDEWVFLLKIEPLEIGNRILDNPLVHRTPVAILAGSLCAIHLVVCRPDLCLGNLYRISLVAVVFLGIPLVAVFEYHPVRYYTPLLPAYLLLVLEWIHLRGWEFPVPRASLRSALLTVVFLLPWFYYLLGFLLMGRHVRFTGDNVNLIEVLVVLVLAIEVWLLRSYCLRGRVVAATLLLLLLPFLVYNTRRVASFFVHPSFHADEVRSQLMLQLPQGSIVGGVWAPFFALGTPFKALYIAAAANPAMRIPEVAPDYIVLSSGNRNSASTWRYIRWTRGMRLGQPIFADTYNDTKVLVLPLEFDRGSEAYERRGPFFTGRALAREGQPAQAEPLLREFLNSLEQTPQVDPALIADARSEWGACLIQLGRHSEAEEPLLAAYELVRPDGKAPGQVSARTTLRRLVALYDAWNKPAELARYRSLLEAQ